MRNVFRIFIGLMLLTLSYDCSGQTNILSAINPPRRIEPVSVVEYGPHYYMMIGHLGPYSQVLSYYPTRFTLIKVDKGTNQILDSAYLFGDTHQIDSSVFPFFVPPVASDGRIYVVFQKVFVKQVSPLKTYSVPYILKIDTQLQNVSQVRLSDTIMSSSDICTVGANKIAYTYKVFDSTAGIPGTLSKFILLDTALTVLREDTVGYSPAPTSSTTPLRHAIVQNTLFDGQRTLITGFTLFGKKEKAGTSGYDFYLADTAMNVVDTFYHQVYPYGPGSSSVPALPQLCVLPSKAIIGGAPIRYDVPNANDQTHTMLFKLGYSNRFAKTAQLVITGMNATDKNHGRDPMGHFIGYNPIDNLVYFSNYTHAIYDFVDDCLTPDNYIQIICTDTNLNLRWRKFIPAGTDLCAKTQHLVVCSGRPGILVVGNRNGFSTPTDTAQYKQFMYYVDSTSPGLSAHPNSELRGQIAVYPNPATDRLIIDDVLSTVHAVSVMDIHGRLVKQFTAASGQRQISISLDGLGAGVFLVRIMTRLGGAQTVTVLKR